jgi:hypothetical protein
LQEEYDLLPAYIDKAMLAFRQVEEDMKKGAYASVCLETQLKVQPKLGVGRSSKSLLALLKPRKRKRSAGGGATSPERSPGAAAVNINNNISPAHAAVELRRAQNAPAEQHVRCLFKYT